jgi:prevent-host-death family protein
MDAFSVKEAAEDLSRLVDRAAEGEEILIVRSGRPVAKLVRAEVEPRKPGRLKGRIRMGPDFDDPLPEEIAAPFRGEGD